MENWANWRPNQQKHFSTSKNCRNDKVPKYTSTATISVYSTHNGLNIERRPPPNRLIQVGHPGNILPQVLSADFRQGSIVEQEDLAIDTALRSLEMDEMSLFRSGLSGLFFQLDGVAKLGLYFDYHPLL